MCSCMHVWHVYQQPIGAILFYVWNAILFICVLDCIEGELYELNRQRNIDDRLKFMEKLGLGGAKKQLGDEFKKAAALARAK